MNAVSVPPSVLRAVAEAGAVRRRAGLLAGAATLSLMMASGAHAQVAVQAKEGTDLGTIEFTANDDALYVDVGRLGNNGQLNLGQNGGNGPVASGGIDNQGGFDRLYLTASGIQSRAVVTAPVAGFTGGVIYDVYGTDSILTLTGAVDANGAPINPPETIAVTGNGTARITGSIVSGDHTAIRVQNDGAAQVFDSSEKKLDLVIAGTITGTDAFVHVDAINGGDVSLIGARIDLRSGIGVDIANDANMFIDKDSEIRAVDSSNNVNQNAILVRSIFGGTIHNQGLIVEQGDANGPGTAADRLSTGVVLSSGSTLYNDRVTGSTTRFGTIRMHGYAVDIQGSGANVVNAGLIQSDTLAAINTADMRSDATAIVRNLAGGTIQGVAMSADDPNVFDHYTVAFQGGWGTDIIVNGGTINGNIALDGDDEVNTAPREGDVFLAVANAAGQATGTVDGTIDGGVGDYDAYGLSFNQSGTYTASNAILAGTATVFNFERHGVEALGATTTATFTSNETLTNGLSLLGNGTIVNDADITTDRAGIVTHQAAENLRFINNTGAVVTAAGDSAFESQGGELSSFENRGSLMSTGGGFVPPTAVYIDNVSEDDAVFSFNNSGTIESVVGRGIFLVVDGETDAGADINFTNSGTVRGGRSAAEIAAEEGTVTFTNSGTITGGDGAQLYGATVNATNTGTIEATGESDTALSLRATGQVNFANNGTVRANSGGSDEFLSAALAINLNNQIEGTVVNGANGVIEATGANSAAIVAAGGSPFTLTNDGTIRGSGTDTAGAQLFAGNLVFEGGVASAIQTHGSTDTIVNQGAGRIIGNVDLGDRDDIFEARGASALTGELRLGDGNDTLLLAGGTISGIAQGGAGDDTLRIDLSQDRSINGSNFRSFESIVREGNGTGILTAEGTFDVQTLNLDGMTLRVAANTTLDTAGALAIQGSDNAERLILEGTVNGDINLGLGDDYVDLANGAAVTGTINGGAGGNDTIGFRITADADASSIPDVVDFESLAVSGNHTLTLDTAFNTVTLRDGADLVIEAAAGTIGNIVSDDVSDQIVVVRGQLTGGVNLGAGNDRLTLMDVRDTISTALIGGDGIDELILNLTGATTFSDGAQGFETITVMGAAPLIVNGDFGAGQSLNFGDDPNALTLGADLIFAGSVDGNGGADTLTVMTGGADSRTVISGQVQEFETLDAQGDGTLALTGASYTFNTGITIGGDLELGAGTALTGNAGIAFDDGNNRLTLNSGASVIGTIDARDGIDTLALDQGQGTTRLLSSVSGFSTFEDLEASGEGELRIDTNASFDTLSVNGGFLRIMAGSTLTAPLIEGGGGIVYSLAAAPDPQSVDGVAIDGVFVGSLDLGGGSDNLSIAGTMTGDAVLGAGADSLTVAGRLTGNALLGLAGENEADRVTVEVGGTLDGNIATGGGADVVTVLGSVTGGVDLGDGDDRLVYGGSITGLISGGAGTDTLAFNTAGTYATPTVYNGTGFDSFESLAVAGGVVSITAANTSWTDLNVTGGRLIGQAETTITSANTINVSAGGTFGTAGIVNGNINVLGTLSPGASPGTMTVNGNVTMGAGSNLLIELTPTAGTDLLDVNGTLTIANGAAIDITGALGNSAGSLLDIVVADTITGRFTTINKSATVFGFVVQNGNRIQIRSEFSNDDAYPTNVQASVAYANQVLRDSYGVQAFTSALNILTDAQGVINQQAFQQLTPEAYGSATQIGVENALSVADASRTLRMSAPGHIGFYGFAQGLTGWSDIEANADTGAAKAKQTTTGFFGGIGYGSASGVQLGAFVGKIDSKQTLQRLAADTDTSGYVAGVYADAKLAGLGVHALAAYSDADALTTRHMAASPTAAHGEYGLDSFVADLTVDYAIDMGKVQVAPKLGVTYVNAKRGDVVEGGANSFDLAVDGDRHDAWFGDASVSVSGVISVGGYNFAPYAEVGVRQRLNDGGIAVTGGFADAPGAPIVVAGVERDDTVARFGLGFGLDVTPTVRIHAGYNGEFKNADRSNFTGGLSIKF